MRAPLIKKQEIEYQKQLVQVIISYLCFLRKQFLKDCFVTRKIGEMNIHVLQNKTENQEAYLLYQILEFGIPEALELNCLKTIEYCIHDANTDNIIETYIFNFQHIPEMEQVSEFNIDSLLVEFTKKIRLLVQTLDPFTAETYFTVRLDLSDDLRPYRSWHPPYFKCKRLERISKATSKNDTITLKIGNVILPGNTCNILVRSTHDALLYTEQTEAPSKVEFDPEFIKVIGEPNLRVISKPESDDYEVTSPKPSTSHVKEVYDRIKAFLLESKIPVMKEVVENLSGVSHQVVKEYFLKLCKESFLTRRGRRYYFTKNADRDMNKVEKRISKIETPQPSKRRRLEQEETEEIVEATKTSPSWYICEAPVVSKIKIPTEVIKEHLDCQQILNSAGTDSKLSHRCLVSEQPILQAKKSLKLD